MNKLFQFDDFAPNALEVRNAVIANGFSSEIGPDGGKYIGISQYQVPHWSKRIGELLGCTIDPKLSCFRLNLAGELPHSWVHSDEICAEWASVLYLNLPEQCQGGTAFWRHKKTGITRTPFNLSQPQHIWLTAEWKKKDAWEQYGMATMKFNRFITYPTCFFHSRWPWEAFGTSPEDGRLIWVCFYDRKPQ